MEEAIPARFLRTNETSSSRTGNGKGRDAAEDGGDLLGCSGKQLKSITAGMIADCVALCCCPCAVVNLLTLALVKAPWKVGRRCLGLGKKKRKCQKIGRECVLVERGGVERLREGVKLETQSEFGGGSPRFEAEKVWFELYQIGHLGFGRVSNFTGVQSPQVKSN